MRPSRCAGPSMAGINMPATKNAASSARPICKYGVTGFPLPIVTCRTTPLLLPETQSTLAEYHLYNVGRAACALLLEISLQRVPTPLFGRDQNANIHRQHDLRRWNVPAEIAKRNKHLRGQPGVER